MAAASSGTGSSPITRLSCGLPCKKAALISKDPRLHPCDTISCKSNIFDCRPSVGLSLGTSVKLGSKYPRTTSRAFGLWVCNLEPDFSMVDSGFFESSPRSFHTNNHLHRSICSGASLDLRIFDTVPVANQFLISVCFASSKAFFSSALSMESFTSVLCFFSVEAKRISSGDSSTFKFELTDLGTSTSNLQAHGVSVGSTVSILSSQHRRWVVTKSSSASMFGIGVSRYVGRLSCVSDPSWFSPSGSSSGCSWDWLELSSFVGGISALWLLGVVNDLDNSGWGSGMDKFPGRFMVDGGDSASLSSVICLASAAQTGLTCSGARRCNRSPLVAQIDKLSSCWTTFNGPNQCPWLSDWGCHIITHSPGWYPCLSGLERLKMALRRAISLSALWKATRARSLRASFCRNSIPWASSLLALACEDNSSQLTIDPGSLDCLPKTRTSGAYPLRMLKLFFAWVHCIRACWSSAKLDISWSWSNLFNIFWRICPCRSNLPFCQWACGEVTISLTSCFCRNPWNASLVNSVAESMTRAFGGPAQLNHASEIFAMACSAVRFGAGMATWKLVAWSKTW